MAKEKFRDGPAVDPKPFDKVKTTGEPANVATFDRLSDTFEGDAEAAAEQVKAAKEAVAKMEALIRKVNALNVPQSMKDYMIVQNLSDATIDAMESAWSSGKGVTHGTASWGDRSPE